MCGRATTRAPRIRIRIPHPASRIRQPPLPLRATRGRARGFTASWHVDEEERRCVRAKQIHGAGTEEDPTTTVAGVWYVIAVAPAKGQNRYPVMREATSGSNRYREYRWSRQWCGGRSGRARRTTGGGGAIRGAAFAASRQRIGGVTRVVGVAEQRRLRLDQTARPAIGNPEVTAEFIDDGVGSRASTRA